MEGWVGRNDPGFPALLPDRTRPQPVPSWSRLVISHVPSSQFQVGRQPNMNPEGCVRVCSSNHRDKSVKIRPPNWFKKKKPVNAVGNSGKRDSQFASGFNFTWFVFALQLDTNKTETSHLVPLLLSFARACVAHLP